MQSSENTEISGKSILIIGAGNMGKPLIKGLCQSQAEVLVSCGTSEGKDATALKNYLESESVDSSAISIKSRREIDLRHLKQPDIIIYTGKPIDFDKTVKNYKHLINENTHFAHICAGLTPELTQARLGNLKPKLITAMPSLAGGSYGQMQSSEANPELGAHLFQGLGKPITLKSEDELHSFTAAACSSPAYVAEFLRQHSEGKPRSYATQWLRKIAAGEDLTPGAGNDSYVSDTIGHEAVSFYNRWLAYTRETFKDDSASIVSGAIDGTLDYMEKHHYRPEEMIAKVRSKRGTTNAGLLYMGNPPPNDPAFGEPEHLTAQNELAKKYGTDRAANSIISALLACEGRSRGTAISVDNPLEGIDESHILQQSRKLNSIVNEKDNSPSIHHY